jgi:hypothetical protein
MAQAGYTPISLYFSTTAAAVPVNTNLANGELAINITDGKLYYKDNGGTVRLLASNATSAPVLSFQTSLSGLTPSTATTGVVTLAGTLGAASGGTGLTTLATGSLSYGAGTSAFSTLAIGTAGQILTVNSGATAPQWSTLSGVAVTTFSAGTTGFTPSSATAGAITLAGTLNVANGGTGLTTLTANYIPYGNGTSAFANSSIFQFNGTNFGVGAAPISTVRQYIRGTGATSATWALYIDNSTPANIFSVRDDGNVGIGLSSAAFKLQTSGVQNANDIVSTNSTTGASLRMQMIDAYAALFTTTSYPITLGTNNTERLRIDTSGNVGIGTSSPSSRLHVYGSSSLTTLTLGNSVANDYSFIKALSYPQAANGYTLLAVQAFSSLVSLNAQAGELTFTKEGAGSDNKTYFNLSLNNGTSFTEYLRIASTGAFGLSGANYGTSGQVLTSGGSGAAPTWTTVSGGGSQWTTSGTQIYYNTGNVGIGTTSPDTYTDGGKNLTILSSTASTRANLALVGTQSAANEILGRLNFTNTNSSNTAYRVAMIDGLRGSDNNSGYLTFSTGYTTAASEHMRIDEKGRVGIDTTAATTNLARLQVSHNPSEDRYGVYVPGGSYVGSGPSGANYGGWFKPHVSNATGTHIGVYGEAGIASVGSAQYGGYFSGGSSASTPNYGVYAIGNQSDSNGPGFAYGGYFSVTTSNPSPAGSGGNVAVRAESLANKGSVSFGVYSTTLSGANNILGYNYEHNGSLMFRVKANGGIDNFSANNTNLSDRREKKDFAPAKSYLETICAIPVQTFKYIEQQDDLPNLGVVAQDVQAVAPELVLESNWAKHDEEPKMRLSVYETDLVYALMKSIQELKAEFDEYKASHP